MKKHFDYGRAFHYFVILIALAALFVGCEKDNEFVLVQTRLPVISAKACEQADADGLQEVYEKPLVISTSEEMADVIACTIEMDVDFEKEFLVVVKICSACGILRKQEVMLHDNKLIYSIEIQNTICAATTCASYVILIPKEYLNYPIEMNITKYY